MPGPTPKPDHLRQRRNKTSTNAVLTLPTGEPPELPDRGPGRGNWHPAVTAWWAAVWRSPMASQYQETDYHGLVRVAELVQHFHTFDPEDSVAKITGLHAEIRQAQQAYGLTPIDLRRLQWKLPEAKDTEKPETTPEKPAKKAKDPRKILEMPA